MKKKLYFLVIILVQGILLLIAIKYGSAPSLLITEVCSHNDSIIYNEEGLFPDYVEIYNNTSEKIDLAEYYLTDNDSSENYYSFEGVVLEPGQYKMFFMNEAFSISDGETVYLFDNSGKIVDRAETGIIEADKVLARNPINLEWKENVPPSPGESNILEEVKKKHTPENVFPRFSVEPGFYDESFYLEIEVDGDYEIYYTTDGTEPNENSILYGEPIYITDVTPDENVYSVIGDISLLDYSSSFPNYPVDKCNVIRAVAVGKDGSVSKETVGSYFINYDGRVGYEDVYVLSMTTNPENLFSYEKGIYVVGKLGEACRDSLETNEDKYSATVNYTMSGKGWRRPAVVELFDIDRTCLYTQEVQIGVHGGWSTAFNQKGFNLIANNAGEDDKYVFPGLFEGGETSNTSLMLRSGGFRDWQVTKFRDVLNQTLVQDRNVTILRSVPCQVFVDGEYWGLYNLQERIDRGLIAKNFGVKEEDVLIFKHKKNVIGADDALYDLYADVVRYAKENDLSIKENYENMEKMIDIQSYIDYYCFQIYVANCDSVANNYSCWRTLEISDEPYYDGRWRWVIYDTDDSQGMVEELSEANADSFNEGHWSVAPMEDPLFSSLVKNEEFSQRFVETFIEMANTNFSYKHVEAVIDSLCKRYMYPMILSVKRFENKELLEEAYLERVDVIRNFFAERKAYILYYMDEALGN